MHGKSVALWYCISFLLSTVTIHANTYDIFKKHKEVKMN
jgi:hydrogenase/urease accessory protein HupE